MARTLVAIRVKIFIEESTGYAKYPDFNVLPENVRANMNWSRFIDSHGSGWIYDKKAGHRETDALSPFGMQWGILLVPAAFADAAVAQFPNEVSQITNVEAKSFYETRVSNAQFEEDVDVEVLQRIKLKQDLNVPLTVTEQRALDPNDDEIRGITRNRNKTWEDRLTKDDTEIDDRVRTLVERSITKEDELDKAWRSHFSS